MLALLPGLCAARAVADPWWLAHPEGQPWAVVGAAALEPFVRPDDGREGCGGFPLHLHVLPRWRRRGLGRSLVERLVAQARGWQVDSLQTPGSHAADEPAAAFMRALGARPGVTMHHFLGETGPTLAAYESREQTLRRRGRIPPGFAQVPLHEVPADASASLLAWQVGGGLAAARDTLARRLQHPQARALSFAVWDGAMLAALLLGSAEQGVGQVDHWVAEPSLRHGWPALLALTAYLRALRDLGIATGHYSCSERATATMNVARHTGAARVAVRHVYMIDLFANGAGEGPAR